MLLSGGLDTTILAHVVASRPRCYTVRFPLFESPDVPCAKAVSVRLGLEWSTVDLTPRRLAKVLPEVVKALKTFDPMEIRNSVAVYEGLSAAKRDGYSRVMTGDGADELFAGYSFSFNLPPRELRAKLRDLWRVMRFSSGPMAGSLGISASLPYLDPRVARFAEGLGHEELVGSKDGVKYGKLILRVAFEEVIGEENAWRVKTPIEFGSGTTFLPKYYEAKVSDESFSLQRSKASKEGVKIRDKEHMHYYQIYRDIFPPPSAEAEGACRCPECGGDAEPRATFCVTCGAYPIKPRRAD